ncbi:MAG: creatininase family protein [Gammaproteobacteria bacterium]|nr:creatininase family protein [Gammaproteobacteria bacterium]
MGETVVEGVQEVEWARLKAHELRALAERDAVVVVPVAAMEQHGPHLPVQVDSRLATEVAQRAARKVQTRRPTVVLPVIWCGLSEHHMPFGGTITLDYQTLFGLFRCIVDSVHRHGFKDVLILNGHGGNILASQMIAQDLSMQLPVTVIAATYWLEAAGRLAPLLEDQSNVLHAGEAETSMMMALTPELVDDSDLAAHAVSADLGFLQAGEGSFRWRDLSHVTPNGVIGNPAHASADKGERLLEAAAQAVADLIGDPKSWATARDLRGNGTAGVSFRR